MIKSAKRERRSRQVDDVLVYYLIGGGDTTTYQSSYMLGRCASFFCVLVSTFGLIFTSRVKKSQI